jgi:DNA-binding protein H-NS
MYSDTSVNVEMELSQLQNVVEEQQTEEEAKTQDIIVDVHMMALYNRMKDNGRINNQEQELDPNKPKKEFKEKIKIAQ